MPWLSSLSSHSIGILFFYALLNVKELKSMLSKCMPLLIFYVIFIPVYLHSVCVIMFLNVCVPQVYFNHVCGLGATRPSLCLQLCAIVVFFLR